MDNELITLRGTVTPVGWQPPNDLTHLEWEQVGSTIKQVENMTGWIIGDWLASGERKWGEMYAEAMELTGLGYDRLRQLEMVSKSVEIDIRISNLSISHHLEIAKFRDDPDRQRHWLQQAEENDWSVRQLREAIQESERPKFLVFFSTTGNKKAPEGAGVYSFRPGPATNRGKPGNCFAINLDADYGDLIS